MCTLKLGVLQKEPVPRQIRKTTEKLSLGMAKKCVETYLLLNAAAQYPKPGCTTNHKEKSMIVMMFYRELKYQNCHRNKKEGGETWDWPTQNDLIFRNFHDATRTSSTSHQNINFWLIRFHVTQKSEITSFITKIYFFYWHRSFKLARFER